MEFKPVESSLDELLGGLYMGAVCRARAALTGEALADIRHSALERVELWPAALQKRLQSLVPRIGTQVAEPLAQSARGGGTQAFQAVSRATLAPLSGLGCFRVGEDGRLHVISKSEHYHALLGHGFPGYRLLEKARALGIPNATHNNTRGHVTRLLEEELIREANSVAPGTDLAPVLTSTAPDVLNRVLNIETGSLAVEAALKMVLARFYAPEAGGSAPTYRGRVPVIVVLGDDEGRVGGNYHGTTTLTQMLRGMWPELKDRAEAGGLFRVCPVRPNVIEDVERAFREYDGGSTKIAAFFHEVVMMNYGARRLSESYLTRVYALCREHDVPTVADEIQSCMWYEGTFLFPRYGLKPSIVVVGKGFSGGEYPASRVLSTPAFDLLPQFGALVTNGQEELASLAYLITLTWARANGRVISEVGRYLESAFQRLAVDFPSVVAGVEGWGHLLGLRFRELAQGKAFTDRMTEAGFDISVQSYKAACPPVALTKLPIIADTVLVDHLVVRMREILGQIR